VPLFLVSRCVALVDELAARHIRALGRAPLVSPRKPHEHDGPM
jgi:hypothetical protein